MNAADRESGPDPVLDYWGRIKRARENNEDERGPGKREYDNTRNYFLTRINRHFKLDWKALHSYPVDGAAFSGFLFNALKESPPDPLSEMTFLNEKIHPKETPPDLPVYVPAVPLRRRPGISQKWLHKNLVGLLWTKFRLWPDGMSDKIKRRVLDENPAVSGSVASCIHRVFCEIWWDPESHEKDAVIVTANPALQAVIEKFLPRSENPDIKFIYDDTGDERTSTVKVHFLGLAGKMWKFICARLYDWGEMERMNLMGEALESLLGITVEKFEASPWSYIKGVIMNMKNDALKWKMKETAHHFWRRDTDKKDADEDNFLLERIAAKHPRKMRPGYCDLRYNQFGEIDQPGAVGERQLSWGVDSHGKVRAGPAKIKKTERVFYWDSFKDSEDPAALYEDAEYNKEVKGQLGGLAHYFFADENDWSMREYVPFIRDAIRKSVKFRQDRLAALPLEPEPIIKAVTILENLRKEIRNKQPEPRAISRKTVSEVLRTAKRRIGPRKSRRFKRKITPKGSEKRPK